MFLSQNRNLLYKEIDLLQYYIITVLHYYYSIIQIIFPTFFFLNFQIEDYEYFYDQKRDNW